MMNKSIDDKRAKKERKIQMTKNKQFKNKI